MSDLMRILTNNETRLLNAWINEQSLMMKDRRMMLTEDELTKECTEFLKLLNSSLIQAEGNFDEIESPVWQEIRLFLNTLSKERGQQGFSPSEIATFIFSLKRALFDLSSDEFKNEMERLIKGVCQIALLLDKLGLYTIECSSKVRENIIKQQQEEMLELSSPVIKLWDKIVALPMIGTLDSDRAQIVMENLLQSIITFEAEVAIIDITGVPNVDTLVAQHLLKTVTAAGLMGAECIISGMRPQIAQTIVHLGIDLEGVLTKSTLADALILAISKIKSNASFSILAELNSAYSK
ncbi:MAG: anti-anti-sigma regulatory factor (antagonist of anti-sigma factor) [Gammaproteobacteria bacterium]|jgi:rsbT co-antagonist protein RsbR|nr:anti-anti-sigma regulatory factor (antagonist of anti-sigma factor) [Gammaproteobacteria bacterium]